ncbi:MAG: acetylxylan esterase [Armatimonadota bacterium]
MDAARIILRPHDALPTTARWHIIIILACWLLCRLALAQAPHDANAPAVAISPQDGGGYVVTTSIYRARINPDGNLHSLQVNGVEFLDDGVRGSAGASFFTDNPVPVPTLALNDRKLTAINEQQFRVQYEFNEGFISVTLRHEYEPGASYIAVCTKQIDFVENLARAGMAAAPANYDWPDVAVTVPSGEYLELRGGSHIWGQELGRQVWECSNLAPKKNYHLMLIMGQRSPRIPGLTQLTTLTAGVDYEDGLVPAGKPVSLQIRFDNNSNEPINTEVVAHVKSYLGKVLLDDKKPLACPPRQSVSLNWVLTPTEPEFYTAEWSVNLKGAQKRTSMTFGYQPEALAVPSQVPPDFAEYWNRVLADAGAAKVSLTRLEETKRSTGTVTVYRIAVEAEGKNCYGWLSVPKFPGKYPGLLLLPGDRVSYISPNAALADCGFVVMSIEPTGQEINGALKPLIAQSTANLNDPEKFGLRPVMINYLRAVTALASVPEVDPNRLGVSGVGLGGGMALVLGAIDERIQAIAPDVPNYCNIELNRSEPRWPYREITAYLRKNPDQEQAVLQTLRYYDAANFAGQITCPVLVSAGINDAYSRPTNIYGMYNRLAGPKAIRLYPGGHEGGGTRHWEEKIRWLIQVLGRPEAIPAAAGAVSP